jgi:hypothetical protein
LHERGNGIFESTAVWAGVRDGWVETIDTIYFLGDFVGRVQCRGYHSVPAKALELLFEKLQQGRRLIIGDVHTHPTDWVGLSRIDQANPIEFRRGVLAVVLPAFAKPEPSLESAGVHEYRGNGMWRTWSHAKKEQVFMFT